MFSPTDQKRRDGGSAHHRVETTFDNKLSDKLPLDVVSNVSEGLGLLNGEANLVFAHLSAVLNELIGCR